jgi:DNA-binding LacI/PurR family transcriptional regulator
MTKPLTTLADIAALAGVTPATVSRALSGNPRISKATRGRVMEIVEQHGFRLNQTARNLRLGRTRAIAAVVPLGHQSAQRISDPFYTTLIGQLMDELARRDHAMLLSAVAPSDGGWLAEIAHSGRADGIIVLCQSDQDAVLREAAHSYRPMVVWGETQDEPYCCVGTDNRRGGRLSTAHLLEAGRRRVAFAGMMDTPELVARHRGYLEAHREAGIEPGPHIPVPFAFEADARDLYAALDRHPEIDGIVAASDMIAMKALHELSKRGRRVPEDVAVVGYDDVTVAAHTNPPLTTIRQDLTLAAALMVDLLFRRMQGEEAPSAQIPLSIIHRQSA